MHTSSYEKMVAFKREYLKGREKERLCILDLGSFNVNGSYKSIFTTGNWEYIGIDLTPGKDVKVVLREPYHWREIKTNSADVFVSGQAFEHIEFFWLVALEMARVIKPEGLCCIIAPSAGPVHRFPVDCWRFYADGMVAIARYAGLDVLRVETDLSSSSPKWHDSLLIARKPKRSFFSSAKRQVMAMIHRNIIQSAK